MLKIARFNRRFGEKLKEERMNRRLSQKEVAKDVGIHEKTLSKYESGERGVTISKALFFASYFNFSIDEVLYDQG